MTAEERVASLHCRVDALRRARERNRTTALGATCCVLAAGLVALLADDGMGHSGGTAGVYAGATILFEEAGGYVLAAVSAFMAGVVVTVTCLRRRR